MCVLWNLITPLSRCTHEIVDYLGLFLIDAAAGQTFRAHLYLSQLSKALVIVLLVFSFHNWLKSDSILEMNRMICVHNDSQQTMLQGGDFGFLGELKCTGI